MVGLQGGWEKTFWDKIHCVQSASKTGQANPTFPLFKIPRVSINLPKWRRVLVQALNSQLPCSDVFGPWELLDSVRRDRQELGLIIDLTYTKRYYNLQVISHAKSLISHFCGAVNGCQAALCFFRTCPSR